MTPFPQDMSLIFPELLLAATGLLLLMVSAFRGDRAARPAVWIASAGIVAAMVLTILSSASGATAFSGVFILDRFAVVMKILTLTGALLALLLSYSALKREEMDKPEFATLTIFAVLGMMVMVSANNLLTLYIGFELQSLSLYVLAAFRRDSTRSSEAGLKYFVLGGLSSGLLLYGISLVYGYTGTTSFPELQHVLSAASGPALGVIIGLVFVAAGLAFKVSAVPFHMWTPDVYEGAPTPITAFFALAPKVAAMALFTRFLYEAFGHVPDLWSQIVWFISVASMVVGSLGAVAQSNIKRLMAYSSIANVGFALVGMATGTQEGVQGVIVYMATYVLMTAGAFGILIAMNRGGKMVESVSDLAGLSRSRPGLGLAMLVFMFSFAGVPPFAGFFGKFYVFLPAIHAGFFTLAIIGVLSSVITAFYYLRIIKIMYFDEPAVPLDDQSSWSLSCVIGVTAVATTLFFVVPSLVADQAAAAAASLFVAAP